MTAAKKTCVARTRTADNVRMCPFAKDVDNTITEENGATKARRRGSTLPGIGVTTGRVAHL
jgi:hypothetical protein